MVDVQRLREAKDALENVAIVLDQGWSDWHKDARIFLTDHATTLLGGLSELLAIAEAYAAGLPATVIQRYGNTAAIACDVGAMLAIPDRQTFRLVRDMSGEPLREGK